MNNHETRESWLAAAAVLLTEDVFAPHGFEVPAVRVSVGWPHGGRANAIGQCFPGAMAADKVGQVFISPVLADAPRVLDVLAHELVHAINHAEDKTGHGAPFARIAKKIGLVGKMTATEAGPELRALLEGMAARLGDYPHAALIPGVKAAKSRSGRSVKLECPGEYVVSISRARLTDFGAPTCPCHNETMREA